jgi:aldehyde:ferredoxin oxidoreductase
MGVNSMNNGCWGKILRINLSKMQIRVEEVEEDVFKNFLGGSGLG